jgi:DNA polymerase-3 subunit delta'
VLGLFDLIGQREAAERLVKLVATNRLPHALVFEGPEGSGKMTAARCLAALIACRRPIDGRACSECPSCVKILAECHADVRVIAGDGPRIKIQEVRDATLALQLRPVEGKKKILLVEDAHRMTPEAQNALLKTLEEPPGSAHIVLTTSRLRSILPTVISRCQRVRFQPLSARDIAEILRRDAPGLTDASALLMAALSRGSAGRAKTLDVEALLVARDAVAGYDTALDRPTPASARAAVDHAAELGSDRADMIQSLDLLITWLRDQLATAVGRTDVGSADRIDDLARLAASRGVGEIGRRMKIVLEARRQLDLPNNLNATMIAEQMCLALAGHAEMKPVPLW